MQCFVVHLNLVCLQDQPGPCSDNWPVLAVVWDLGMVQPSVSITKHLIVLYDQVYSIRYVESTGMNMAI